MIDPAIEKAKSSVDGFTLPCGFLSPDGAIWTDIQVREITGEEEEILAAKNMSPVKKINKVMANCTVSIGPASGKEVEAIIPDLPQGDRLFLLLAIRRTSLGDEMPFEAKCPSCERDSQLTVDLSELEIKPMPDPKIRTYSVVLPRSQKSVLMKVMTGRGEELVSKVVTAAGKDGLTASLLARTESVDSAPATLDTLKSLSLADRNYMRDQFEEHEGGVDTEVEVECPGCGFEFFTDIDFGAAGFFNPSAALKIWRKRSSTLPNHGDGQKSR